MRQIIRTGLAASIAIMLTACGAPLTSENSVISSTPSLLSSEATFRNMLRAMKECYPDALTVSSNYFPEAKEGEIELTMVSDFGNIPFAKWLVQPLPSGAKVQLTRRTRSTGFEEALPVWISGSSAVCPYGTKSDPRPPGSETSQQTMPVR